MPGRHIETILEISGQETKQLKIGVRNSVIAIEEEYKPFEISIWQNNGVPAS
jgi:hypothetical protein